MLAQQPILSDVTLERLYETDEGKKALSCIQCGLCVGLCPQGISPRKIVNFLNSRMPSEALNVSDMLDCVSCYLCSTKCPRGISLTQLILPLVKEKLLETLEDVPDELQKVFENVTRYGNPQGESPKKRTDWIRKSGTQVKIITEADSLVDVLWWVDSYSSYHPRNQETTKATARLLNILGIDFGVVGDEEHWAADCIRLVGEKGLFDEEAEKNISVLKKLKFRRIVCSDPHAFDTFRYQYPHYGYRVSVDHVTPFLYQQLDRLKPLFRKRIDKRVTYHDSCVLGRHNGFYEPPRAILKAIPGIEIVEMDHNRENSICCGGGGGGMWLDSYYKEKGLERLSDRRVREAAKTGSDILAVSCPYEISRFEDSLKLLGLEKKIKVMDVVDILNLAVG